MIKKICITFLVFFILSSGVYSADCSIENEPANSLSKYIDNNRKIITNISGGINDSDTEESSNIKDHILSKFNKLVTWDNYGSYFDYYVIFPISNDVSSEVKRDYSLLEDEGEGLVDYLDTVIESGLDEITIENACDGVTGVECDFEGTSSEIILQLVKNQSAIINIYRLTVMGKMTNDDKEKKLQLVDNSSFIDEIEENYGFGKNCTASDGSFFATIMESIKEISFTGDSYKEGVKEWKDAWALLVGNVSDTEYQEKERELLKEELGKQGISGSKAESVLGNLEKFNQNGGYSVDNNFITNSFRHLAQSIEREILEFQKDIFEDFSKDESTETITITNLLNKDEENELTESIATKVSELYNNELPFIAVGDTNTDMIRVDIIDMHNNLNDSINILEKLIPVSERVCNDQDRGNGKCDTD